MAAILGSDPGETVMEDAAIEITINNLFNIRTKKTILFGKTFVVNLLELFKIVLNTLVIW